MGIPLLIILLVMVSAVKETSAVYSYRCANPASRCYDTVIECPYECPGLEPQYPKAKACYINCDSPVCKSHCRHRKPNCEGPGSACYDPRFVGADGVVFYFHGKINEHFSLVSDTNLQINSRFIGHRPDGRTRDFTWIQALGILFKSHKFSLEATKVANWDNEVDNLKFSYNGKDLVLSEGTLSAWYSPEKEVKVERIASKNSVIVTLKDSAEILVNVVPVTKEDDKIHNYKVPSDDCFAHLEVQFRFFDLSSNVDGVLGRTYRTDFENPVKHGVVMPTLSGEEKYWVPSILSKDCKRCLFSPVSDSIDKDASSIAELVPLDCTHRYSGGLGIVCKK